MAKFEPGKSGNPAGRPIGARSKLGEAFIEALHDDFNKNGIEAIRIVRETKPDQYLKVIASLMPRDVNLNVHEDMEELSDAELLARYHRLAGAVERFLN